MKKDLFYKYIVVFISFVSGCSMSVSAYEFSPVNKLINSWVEKNYYPGASIIIVKNDTVVFENCYGNYTPDTEVYIASAGKWLVAATIAAVVDRTGLSWDDSAERWLPEFKGDSKGKIKLRQLLSHTSGIRNYLPLPAIDTFNILQKSIESILPLDAVFTPGSRFEYGGLGMQVAGRMAEVASGKDFETLFQDLIGTPLGMKKTYFTPVNTEGGHSPMLGGGARTILHDYLNFLKMIFHDGNYNGKQILSKASIIEMQADQVGAAKVLPGEYIEKAFGAFHTGIYGFGEWSEKLDEQGNAYQISSPGWAGAYPWINKKDGVYGIFLTHIQGSAAKKDGFSPFYDAPVISGLTSTIVQSNGIKQGFANIGDAMLFYEEKGVGEPLILLHAHSVDRRMWDKQFEELAKHFRVIRYDLRGYGLSSMPVEGIDFTVCEDLKKFMDVLQIEKAHLAGLSLGTLAMRKGSCSDSPFLMSLIDDWRMWQVWHRESSKIFLGDSARIFYQNNKLKIPVLFIVGGCDSKGSQDAAQELSALLPNSKIKHIKNAGHFSCIEQPEVFNKIFLRFIKKQTGRK